MRINFGHTPDAELTYGAWSHDGTQRTAAGTLMPQVGPATGAYSVIDNNIANGDIIVVKEGAIVVGYGTYSDNIAVETTIHADGIVADTAFRLTVGSSDDDAYNNMVVSVTDVSGRDTRARRVTNYVGSTKTVTVDSDFMFPLAENDVVRIWADTYSQTAGAAAIADIADAVWEETMQDHNSTGTTGLQLLMANGGRY